jgi:acylphosphatase
MTTQEMIATEYKRRTDLVNDVNFRKQCVKMAKQLGITSEEWNKDKIHIMLIFANKFCQIENNLN